MAILLNGRVTRKIVKQTVMTSVYGVTFIGARDQIRNAMKDQVTHRQPPITLLLSAVSPPFVRSFISFVHLSPALGL